MKKILLTIFILPLIFLISGCKENTLEKISETKNTYTMNIIYNDDHTLNCSQTLEYKNIYDTTLNNLMFHLYPQSFRQGAKSSVVSTLNYDKCYYNGVSFGGIEISKVKLNDKDIEFKITGNDNDILEINFENTLAPDDKAKIFIEYKVTLPNNNHRFGYGENTINVGNFYPVVCIYENQKFNIESYHYNGDPFYSDIANYNVKLTAPKNLILASSGDIISHNEVDNNKIYNIEAKSIRDFAFVLSDKFNIVTDTINDVKINYFYYKNKYPNEAIKTSVNCIKTFDRIFGKYPYKTLNVVESNFVHGGMEYPNLVLISDAVDIQSDYINVIVHEIAHQWWYGLVGNNEFQYGWLDEGLTEYSTILFYNENPEYKVDTKKLIKNTTNSFVTFTEVYNKVFNHVDTSMNRKLNEYNNESEYVYISYVKGMLLFDNFHELLGHNKFIKCLQTYFNDNKFKFATPDNLINSFESVAGNNLREIFESWINGKVKIIAMN